MATRIATAPTLGLRLVCTTDYDEDHTPRAYLESLTPATITVEGRPIQSAHVDLCHEDLLGDDRAVYEALADASSYADDMASALNIVTGAKYDWQNHPLRKLQGEIDQMLTVYREARAEARDNADAFNATHRWHRDASIGGDGLWHAVPAC